MRWTCVRVLGTGRLGCKSGRTLCWRCSCGLRYFVELGCNLNLCCVAWDRRLGLQELKDNALALLFAGHDTSSSTLYILLHSLAHNPEVLQKLREEQEQVQSAAFLWLNIV